MPAVTTPPGVSVKVHVPVEGKLFSITLPVATLHVGCVILPTMGAVGVSGWALITRFAETGDEHVEAFVTV